jgi:hypothetical protein
MSGIDSWAMVAPRVHHHVDVVVVGTEELVRLDHLEALVHQRRRVDGDLGPHVPRRVGERVLDGDGGQLGGGAAAERPAARGEDDAPHFRLAARAQALPHR